MGKTTFTDIQIKEMREKYEAGATLSQLVSEYGSYPTTISRAIVRAGGTVRPPGYVPKARHVHITRNGLIRWVNNLSA